MYEQIFSSSCMEFLPWYKTFTLSVQDKCANCTRVYKGTYINGFQIHLKSFPFCKDEVHSSDTFLDHALIPFNIITSYMFIG